MGVLRLSGRAENDLSEIWSYIAADSVPSADRPNSIFRDKLSTLADFPMMGRSRPELRPGLRSIPAGSYAIFYRPIENGVEIVRVLHQARDVETLF